MLILHHDITSPRAALAVLRLERLAEEGLPVAFRGIDVLGVAMTLPVTLDQLAELEEVKERVQALGLEMRRPPFRPPTLDAHMVAGLADGSGLGPSWRRTCLEAYWADGADLSAHAVLMELAERVGLPNDAVAALLDDHAARNALRAEMLARRGLGIGGVPVLEVGGTLVSADLEDATLAELAHV